MKQHTFVLVFALVPSFCTASTTPLCDLAGSLSFFFNLNLDKSDISERL